MTIVSPERTLYSGEVEVVRLPGALGAFAVLPGHAPLVSVLTPGLVTYRCANGEASVEIGGGFVEVSDNRVTVCVEEKEG